MWKFTLFVLLAIPWHQLKAQSSHQYVHTGLTLNSYKGELSSFSDWNGSFHIGLLLNRKEKFNGNINIGFGAVTGENSASFEGGTSPIPNRFFKTNFVHLNYDFRYNIIRKENLKVYVSQGIGLFRFNPQDENGESLLEAPDTRAEGETYRNATLMLPTNVGTIYFLPNGFGISLEIGFRNTLTDYIDNISDLGEDGNDNILAVRLAFLVPVGN